MGDDHSVLNYLHALHAARVGLRAGCAALAQRSLDAAEARRRGRSLDRGGSLDRSRSLDRGSACEGSAAAGEPLWLPFGDALVCGVCELDFAWASTSSSAAQRLMDMHHCRRWANRSHRKPERRLHRLHFLLGGLTCLFYFFANCFRLWCAHASRFSCGAVVCDGCSKQRRPLPHKGMPFPERICDRCFFSPPTEDSAQS